MLRKRIPDYPNYTISESGMVIRNGYQILPFINKKGYKIVTLSKDNVQKKFYVHYLVWITFGNRNVKSNEIIAFKDTAKPLHISNLELRTIKNVRRTNL